MDNHEKYQSVKVSECHSVKDSTAVSEYQSIKASEAVSKYQSVKVSEYQSIRAGKLASWQAFKSLTLGHSDTLVNSDTKVGWQAG